MIGTRNAQDRQRDQVRKDDILNLEIMADKSTLFLLERFPKSEISSPTRLFCCTTITLAHQHLALCARGQVPNLVDMRSYSGTQSYLEISTAHLLSVH